jgi:hypothetical protein
VLGPIGALSLPMALKARFPGVAQPERIEEPERHEDQQRYAAGQRSKLGAAGYPEPRHAKVCGDTDSEGESGRDDERELIRKKDWAFSPS